MAESNKNLKIGIAAAGALFSAGILLYWAQADSSKHKSNGNQRQLEKELKEAGLIEVQKHPTHANVLQPKYFLTLLQFIGQTNIERSQKMRTKHL